MRAGHAAAFICLAPDRGHGIARRMSDRLSEAGLARPLLISNWLLVVAAIVFVMVVVGGITRLTESGLSITEWQPVSGAVPPLSAESWAREFALYQRTVEYQTVNSAMTLAEFKVIYFWEYLHRLIGRIIGLAFALPLICFWVRRAIPAGYKPRLLALFALGGLQGAIGWWMVTSGLFSGTSVSHQRLAVHLVLAFIIFSGLIWTALDLRRGRSRMTGVAWFAVIMLFIQMMLGAFVAGLDAGYAFSSWPLMGDALYPAGATWISPGWRNFIDNPITVQFVHRWWAFAAAGALGLLAMRTARRGDRGWPRIMSGLLLVQILLGIATLLTGVSLHVAVTHQAVALLLLGSTIATAHVLGRSRAA
jgi:heme a synthase